jgi:hypothetical protein
MDLKITQSVYLVVIIPECRLTYNFVNRSFTQMQAP